jgi:hypothetical protein
LLIFREEKTASTGLQFLEKCRKRFPAVKVNFSTLQDYKEKTELEQGGSNNRLPILLLGNKVDLPNLRTDRQECCLRFSLPLLPYPLWKNHRHFVSLHCSEYLTQNAFFVTVELSAKSTGRTFFFE